MYIKVTKKFMNFVIYSYYTNIQIFFSNQNNMSSSIIYYVKYFLVFSRSATKLQMAANINLQKIA